MSAMATEVPRSGNRDIDGVLWGVKWNVSTLTFAFPSAASDYSDYPAGAISGFEAFNTQQRLAVSGILKDIAGITNLAFDFTKDAANANLRFGEATKLNLKNFDGSGPIETAIGLPPDLTEIPKFAFGDTFYNPKYYNSPVIGSYGYHTLLHEIGHALGLKHGHTSQLSPDGSFAFRRLSPEHDTMEYSVMTYRSYAGDSVKDGYNNEEYGFAQSFMIADIAALQYLYGADFEYRSGNTTYRWSEETGEFFVDNTSQGAPGSNKIFMTIWDGGGMDLFDFYNYHSDLRIDLSPGGCSILSRDQRAILDSDTGIMAKGNVYNSLLYNEDPRSLIENANGGWGDDRMIGNAAENFLSGGYGNDRLLGKNGNDTLIGFIGSDVLTGGPGRDVFRYTTSEIEGRDIITDFTVSGPQADRLEFNNTAFHSLGIGKNGTGQISTRYFIVRADNEAQDANDFFIFRTTDHSLWFDPDGSSPFDNDPIRIATFANGVSITTDDVYII